MKKTLKDFTPEVQAKIPEYQKRALEGVFDGQRYNNFNINNAQAAVWHTYEFCGRKKPVIIVAENPYESQIFFNYLKENPAFHPALMMLYMRQNGEVLNKEKDGEAVDFTSQLDSQLRSQLDSQLRSQLYSQLDSQLYSQLYSQLDSQLDSQLRSQLYSQLDSQLRSQLENKKLYTRHSDYLYGLNMYADAYFAWYRFIKDELNVEVKENALLLDKFADLQHNSGIYSAIFSEIVCVVSKYPKRIIRNDQGNLHNPVGQAVEWGYSTDMTKWDCYYVNGRNLPAWIWEKAAAGEITKELFLSEKNAEIKGGIYEVLGQKKMMDLLGAVEVDVQTIAHKNGDLETVTLLKTKEKFEEIGNVPFAWVKMICPSTATAYLVGVEPHHTNALDAIASLSMFNKEEYSFDYRS